MDICRNHTRIGKDTFSVENPHMDMCGISGVVGLLFEIQNEIIRECVKMLFSPKLLKWTCVIFLERLDCRSNDKKTSFLDASNDRYLLRLLGKKFSTRDYITICAQLYRKLLEIIEVRTKD